MSRTTAGPASSIPPPAESLYISRVPTLHAPESHMLPSPLAQTSPATAVASPMTAHPSPMGLQLSPQTTQPPAVAAAESRSAERRASDQNPRSRSSIACEKCRRSKTKCENNGQNTICKACKEKGRQCFYPTPGVPTSPASRRESIGGDRTIKTEPSRRSRVKKALSSTSSTPYHLKDSPRADVDALDLELLTPAVWEGLFEIFQKHYLTDLPFLHLPTFRLYLNQMEQRKEQGLTASPHPPYEPAWLLAFLALTCKFHTGIVNHHDPTRAPDAMKAATYYAKNARDRLPLTGDPSLQRVQAFLMLGLHDWGMFHGSTAWHSIGAACREALLIGLHIEEERVNKPTNDVQTSPDDMQIDSSDAQATNIEKETRRRTFWTCFIFDRYLSSGRLRVSSFQDFSDLNVQLPSSDSAFIRGQNVKTSHLPGFRTTAPGQDNNLKRSQIVYDDIETGDKEGDLSRFIRALDIFWSVLKWSCRGARRADGTIPPWDPSSKFYGFQKRLEEFRQGLPPHMASSSNIHQLLYGARGAVQHFTLMHTILLLCDICSNREYLVYLPFDIKKPLGPTEGPTFKPEDAPEGFWEDSAKNCFKSARNLLDLLIACDKQGILVETPLSGFTAFQLAIVATYCQFFPQMDTEHHMTSLGKGKAPATVEVASENARVNAEKATHLLKKMSPRWQMNLYWDEQLASLKKYFLFAANRYRNEHPAGHGLGDYVPVEPILKEMTADRDIDVHRENNAEFSKLTKTDKYTPTSYTPGRHYDDKSDHKSEDDRMETDGTETPSSHSIKGWTSVNPPSDARTENSLETGNSNQSTVPQSSHQHPFPHSTDSNHGYGPQYTPTNEPAYTWPLSLGQAPNPIATHGAQSSSNWDQYRHGSGLVGFVEEFASGEAYNSSTYNYNFHQPDQQSFITAAGTSFPNPGFQSYH